MAGRRAVGELLQELVSGVSRSGAKNLPSSVDDAVNVVRKLADDFGSQLNFPFRNPAGAVALDEVISSGGRNIPVGRRTGGQYVNPATTTTPETKQFLNIMTEQAQPGYGPAMDPRRSPGQQNIFPLDDVTTKVNAQGRRNTRVAEESARLTEGRRRFAERMEAQARSTEAPPGTVNRTDLDELIRNSNRPGGALAINRPGGALAIPKSIAPSSPARLKVGRSYPIDFLQTDPGMRARRGIMRARRELKDIQEARRYVDASFARNTVDTSNAAAGLVDEFFQVPAALSRVLPTNEGAFLTNLSDPRVLAALGAGGAAGLGAGTYLLNKQQGGSVESPTTAVESQKPTVESRLPVTKFEELFELLEKEKVIDTSLENSLRKELEESRERDVKTDTPTSVIRDERRREVQQQNGDLNAIIDKYTEPMSPEKYSNIADYYRDRDNYASQDSRRDLLAAAVAGLAGLQSENMRTWAQTHPGLAYQLLERQGFNAPETLDPKLTGS